MSKHTPGKWTHDSAESLQIRAEDGGLIATLGWSSGRFFSKGRRGAEEVIANACLIACAPELLAALECEEALDMPTSKGYEVLERHGWNRDDRFEMPASEFVRRLRRAAIAKATKERP